MPAFADECQAAYERLEEITLTVCGNCPKSCCHHGTMLGAGDVPRLHKALLLSAEFQQRLRQGLRGRAAELRSDLAELETAAERALRASSSAGGGAPERASLAPALARWREYAEFLHHFDVTSADALVRLRLYSAVRATAFRVLRGIPGGIAALAEIGSQRPSLRFRGERIPAERCVLHYDGCLAEHWKPAKCANFFCPADPGLVEAVHLAMGFADFLMANIQRIGRDELLDMIRLEGSLGPEYMAPKVLFGPGSLADHIGRTLKAESLSAVIQPRVPQLMLSAEEVLQLLERGTDDMPQITLCGAVQGAALYEIALGIQRAERKGVVRPWYVVAEQLQRRAVLPHPLWQDRAMAQPVGALEAYVVDTE
ncbi:MAG: hypothetical protein PVH68_17475 [Armatimonadota bacterium]|jgi:hypothetical protein